MPKLTSWRRRLTKMTVVTSISTNFWSWWIQLHWGTEIPINVQRLVFFSKIKQRLCTAVLYCTFNTPFHFSLKCQIIEVSVILSLGKCKQWTKESRDSEPHCRLWKYKFCFGFVTESVIMCILYLGMDPHEKIRHLTNFAMHWFGIPHLKGFCSVAK